MVVRVRILTTACDKTWPHVRRKAIITFETILGKDASAPKWKFFRFWFGQPEELIAQNPRALWVDVHHDALLRN